jgi:hypothetical protein
MQDVVSLYATAAVLAELLLASYKEDLDAPECCAVPV